MILGTELGVFGILANRQGPNADRLQGSCISGPPARPRRLTGSVLNYISLPPEFEPRRGHI